MENDEFRKWDPKHPRLKQASDIIRDLALYRSNLQGLFKPTADLLEGLSYGDRLTTGSGETTHLKPEVLEAGSDLSNLIPGKALGGAMASIGPMGLRKLGDAGLWKKYLEIKEALGKTKPKEWTLQKEIVEENPGWFAVPRGRDADPTLPHVKFGYEIPEAKIRNAKGFDLNEVYDSPRHYAAYPELERYSLSTLEGPNSGRFNARDLDIGVGPHDSDQELLKTLNHEIAHFVQFKEGWPSGTSPSGAEVALRRIGALKDQVGLEGLPPGLRRQADIADLMRAGRPKAWSHVEYRRAAGEQMAEAAAKSAAKGGGLIPKMYTSTPALMYDPAVQGRSILELTKKLDEVQYRKDLADEIQRLMK